MTQYGYCEEHYITWDNSSGGCPICRQKRRMDTLEKKFEELDRKIDRVGKVFNGAEKLFKQILMEVKKNGR